MAEDVRIIKNKRVIENAIILLLQRKEFSKITIQDICQEALVSRSTFYAHYLDKYDLLEKIVDKYFSVLQELIASRFSTVELINIDAIFLLLSQRADARHFPCNGSDLPFRFFRIYFSYHTIWPLRGRSPPLRNIGIHDFHRIQ